MSSLTLNLKVFQWINVNKTILKLNTSSSTRVYCFKKIHRAVLKIFAKTLKFKNYHKIFTRIILQKQFVLEIANTSFNWFETFWNFESLKLFIDCLKFKPKDWNCGEISLRYSWRLIWTFLPLIFMSQFCRNICWNLVILTQTVQHYV